MLHVKKQLLFLSLGLMIVISSFSQMNDTLTQPAKTDPVKKPHLRHLQNLALQIK